MGLGVLNAMRNRRGFWLALALASLSVILLASLLTVAVSSDADERFASAALPDARVFRQGRTASDVLPEQWAPPGPAGKQAATIEIDAANAHRVENTRGMSSRWIAPAGVDRICLINLQEGAEGPSYACDNADDTPNVNYSANQDGTVDLFGYMPDGFEAVDLVLSNGERITAVAHENTFGAEATAEPVTAYFHGPNGTSTVRLAH